MIKKVPKSELESRLNKFRKRLDEKEPQWELALIISKINQYYFTGTMQEGVLFIFRDREPEFFVRRSFQRAADESLFDNIKPMNTYRDASASVGKLPETVYLETEIVPLAMYERLKKYFGFTSFKSIDSYLMEIRTVKSPYELEMIKKAGQIHAKAMEERIPALLREGMTEGELMAEMFKVLQQEGHHGVTRFNMFDSEILMGHIAFGDSSIYPTYFDGPGGNIGLSPASPFMGSQRRLKKGDLVFIDTGCCYEGYNSDKTFTYVFGGELPEYAVKLHQKCVDIQNRIAGMLRPGEKPSHIYSTIMESLDEEFLTNFMGYDKRKVKFLGHGIGLHVNELPVLAKGFDDPIQDGMVFAVEPKVGIKGIGMVGLENTFIVTPEGGVCITGNHPGLMKV